jgi:hypothetical protein
MKPTKTRKIGKPFRIRRCSGPSKFWGYVLEEGRYWLCKEAVEGSTGLRLKPGETITVQMWRVR